MASRCSAPPARRTPSRPVSVLRCSRRSCGTASPNRLLPGTGVAALSETIALTRHALSVGVDTVVMLPPFYYKGVTDDGVYASYSEVVQRLGNARLRIVLSIYPPDVGAADLACIDRAAACGLSDDLRRDQGFLRRLRQHDRNGRALFGLCGAWPVRIRCSCRCCARAARGALPQPPISSRAISPTSTSISVTMTPRLRPRRRGS